MPVKAPNDVKIAEVYIMFEKLIKNSSFMSAKSVTNFKQWLNVL